ncbi:prephenate dehydrogenase [Pontibacillus litoralis JSM 072002]|uniref:Prephenate dehydrogenase n=2 Tax=Pontibacillus TaxID=289201 RepID=A0A0A5G9V1_9BACI|nr:prephenate dehydrogenase [Pontibacillus litoralis]KGX87958.1 prephenate dehydrogenase [Pontibacillus litoralis JSM 072002]
MNTTILVSGLGLIGGSIALNLMKHPNVHVIGYDQNQDTRNYAYHNRFIHQAVDSFNKGVQLADIVMLAMPVQGCIQAIQEMNEMQLDRAKLVTDVASVKKPILDAAAQWTNEQLRFVGGHPMAGSHKQGIIAAKAHLFENAYYLFVPGIRSTEQDVSQLQHLLRETKSHYVTVDKREHDQMTGVISHFPHLIASSLVHQAKKWQRVYPFTHELAAGGFRDITRIASSHPKMWNDILIQNKESIIPLLNDWIQEMNELKQFVEGNNHEQLHQYLKEAKVFRDDLPTKNKGAIPAFYDVFVDIKDQPGALSEVTHILAMANISIVNIRILEVREGITGALRLSFQTEADKNQCQYVLKRSGYDVMIQE